MAAQLGARRLEMLMAQAVREMLEELSAPVVTFSTSASAARLRSSLAAIHSRSVFLTRTRLPEETGLSFGAWRRRVRLLEAMVMQVQGDAMARIAATVGYGSPRALQTMVRRTLAAHMHKL